MDEAIAARGGPLLHFARDADLRVYEGFQGAWHWQLAFALPERLRVVLQTAAEDQTVISDGEQVRSFVGGAAVSSEPARGSAIAGLARFVALTNLDVLADATRVTWQELPAAERPPGSARALRAGFRSDPQPSVRIGFDAALRVVVAEGDVSIPGLGAGLLEARFADYRRVGGRWLPFEIAYRFRAARLLDERVTEWRPDDPAASR